MNIDPDFDVQIEEAFDGCRTFVEVAKMHTEIYNRLNESMERKMRELADELMK